MERRKLYDQYLKYPSLKVENEISGSQKYVTVVTGAYYQSMPVKRRFNNLPHYLDLINLVAAEQIIGSNLTLSKIYDMGFGGILKYSNNDNNYVYVKYGGDFRVLSNEEFNEYKQKEFSFQMYERLVEEVRNRWESYE